MKNKTLMDHFRILKQAVSQNSNAFCWFGSCNAAKSKEQKELLQLDTIQSTLQDCVQRTRCPRIAGRANIKFASCRN